MFSKGSHSLRILLTYIKRQTQPPEFTGTAILDDITVGYYDYETRSYIARGNTTNEDNVIDPAHLNTISDYMIPHFMRRSDYLRPINLTESKFIWLNYDTDDYISAYSVTVLMFMNERSMHEKSYFSNKYFHFPD